MSGTLRLHPVAVPAPWDSRRVAPSTDARPIRRVCVVNLLWQTVVRGKLRRCSTGGLGALGQDGSSWESGSGGAGGLGCSLPRDGSAGASFRVIPAGIRSLVAILAAAPWGKTRWSFTSRVGSAPVAAPAPYYLSIYIYIYIYTSMYIFMSICINLSIIYLYRYLSIYLSLSLSHYLALSIYLSIYLDRQIERARERGVGRGLTSNLNPWIYVRHVFWIEQFTARILKRSRRESYSRQARQVSLWRKPYQLFVSPHARTALARTR